MRSERYAIGDAIGDCLSNHTSLKSLISQITHLKSNHQLSPITYLSDRTSQIKSPIVSPITLLSKHFSNYIAHLYNCISLKSHISQITFPITLYISTIAYLSNHLSLKSHISQITFQSHCTSLEYISLKSLISQITHLKSLFQSDCTYLQSYISPIAYLSNHTYQMKLPIESLSNRSSHISNQIANRLSNYTSFQSLF